MNAIIGVGSIWDDGCDFLWKLVTSPDNATPERFDTVDELRDHLASRGYPTVDIKIVHEADGIRDFEVEDIIDLAGKAERWELAKETAALTRGDLIAAVVNANRRGVSEYEIARRTGVTRATVRDWLGK